MKIKEIITYKIPENNFLSKVLNLFAPLFLIPFLVILFVLVIPSMWFYDKIKTNILGIKTPEYIKKEDILFENEDFKLVKEYYDPVDESKQGEPLYEFFWNLAEYDDEFLIFKILDRNKISQLNNCYITDFKHTVDSKILLQQIKIVDNLVETFLISFDTENGTIETIKEIKDFILTDFSSKKNTIIGYNKTKKMEIKLES